MKSTHAYFVQNYFLACEDCYNEAADYIAKVLADHEMPPAANVSGLSDSFRLSSHLPKINLSTFDGSFDKWENFHNKFTSMIRSGTSLSNLECMHYLCSYVKEDASALTISRLPIIILMSRGKFSFFVTTINVASLSFICRVL